MILMILMLVINLRILHSNFLETTRKVYEVVNPFQNKFVINLKRMPIGNINNLFE